MTLSHRTAEHVGLCLVGPFWLAAFLVAGLIAGPVLGVMEAWTDLRREWRS